jgi:CheY-like chemotaxis protein
MDKTLVAVLNDLMFQVKIQEIAKRSGLRTLFVKSQAEALAQAREKPVLMILDLNYAASDPLQLIEKLKADAETKSVPLIGYVSHVQTDIRQAARECGCDLVLARSAFVQNLGELLEQYTTKAENCDHLS